MGWGSFVSSITDPIKKTVGTVLGGGGSTASTSSSQTANVASDIDIDFDVDKLAEAMQKSTLATLFVNGKIAEQELTAKQKEQQLKEETLKVSKIALQEQMKNNKTILILTTIGIFLTFIGFIYNKKKGGKK